MTNDDDDQPINPHIVSEVDDDANKGVKVTRHPDGSVGIWLDNEYFDTLVDCMEAYWDEFRDYAEYRRREVVFNTILGDMLGMLMFEREDREDREERERQRGEENGDVEAQ